MYYLWMICPTQLLFNFGNKLIFIVIVNYSLEDTMDESNIHSPILDKE